MTTGAWHAEARAIAAERRKSRGAPRPARRLVGRWTPESYRPDLAAPEPEPPAHAPARVVGELRDDMNILVLHQMARAAVAHDLAAAPQAAAAARRAVVAAEQEPTLVGRNAAVAAAEADLARAESYASGRVWDDYARAAAEPLREYYEHSSEAARGRVRLSPPEPAWPGARAAAERYLEALELVMSVSVVAAQTAALREACPVCARPVDDTDATCPCGRETTTVHRASSFKDNSRVYSSTKNCYDDLGNFIKRIDAFEGKQKTPPPERLYAQLESHIDAGTHAGFCAAARAAAPDPDAPRRKVGTSMPVLIAALSATDNSQHYKDLDLIAHRVWGWALPDVTSSGLRQGLIEDYNKTQIVYYENKGERESSLNVSLRLFYHLSARGYPCDIADFKTITSAESMAYHEKMLRLMSERTGVMFTEFVRPRARGRSRRAPRAQAVTVGRKLGAAEGAAEAATEGARGGGRKLGAAEGATDGAGRGAGAAGG